MLTHALRREVPLPLELIAMIVEELVLDDDEDPDDTLADLRNCRLCPLNILQLHLHLLHRRNIVSWKSLVSCLLAD